MVSKVINGVTYNTKTSYRIACVVEDNKELALYRRPPTKTKDQPIAWKNPTRYFTVETIDNEVKKFTVLSLSEAQKFIKDNCKKLTRYYICQYEIRELMKQSIQTERN